MKNIKKKKLKTAISRNKFKNNKIIRHINKKKFLIFNI